MRAGIVLVTGWLAVLLCAGAVWAAPAGPDRPTQTAYLAEQLRKSPVYISDQIPRAVPRSSAPEFAREARRLGVPTYVIVLPSSAYGSKADALLAGVHDRLGRKGLYVAMTDSGLDAVQTYGVSLPGAQDADTATLYELPYDATPARSSGTSSRSPPPGRRISAPRRHAPSTGTGRRTNRPACTPAAPTARTRAS
ncbi:hypothetical protein [Streptomyces sirii]|uniref:hypothetical protein n=1 Tax=Streptomyces sirii TaxID=3127701 RepID=UPI003D36B3F2